MKKVLFVSIVLIFVLFPVMSFYSAYAGETKCVEVSRTLNPCATVYTLWGDEAQSIELYNYNWVLESSATQTYWTKPKRAMYHKFDLSEYIEAGYSVESAVVLFDSLNDSHKLRYIDCPSDTLENGQNYLTVPAHNNYEFALCDLAKANIGCEDIQDEYPGARLNDNSKFDITEYVNGKISGGKTSFTYMVYPYYNSTTVYLHNIPQLHLKLKRMCENSLYVSHSMNRVWASGETNSNNVKVNLRDSDNNILYTAEKAVSENENYYYLALDVDWLKDGTYAVEGDFGSDTVTQCLNYNSAELDKNTVFTSIDYATKTAKVSGKIDGGNYAPVMLTVYKPGYTKENPAKKEAIYQLDVQTLSDGQYNFSFEMNDVSGEYAVYIQTDKKTLSSSILYDAGRVFALDNEVDRYTTTRYAPWLVNWHMTTKEQLNDGYKGGEACQMCWTLEISPHNPDIMLAGTDTNGIWKSVDGGKTWRSSNAGFDIMGVVDIQFDPENPGIVYALGGTGVDNRTTPYAGIYKSYDFGNSWEQVFYNQYYRIIANNIIQFGKRDEKGVRRIFAGGHGTQAGCVYSDDEGVTWNSMGDKLADKVVRDFTVKDDMLVVGTERGVFVSFDNGNSFSEKGPVKDGNSTVTIEPGNYAHWVCAVGADIYETTDFGENWELINNVGEEYTVKSLRYGVGTNPKLYMNYQPVHYPLRYSTDGGRTFNTPVKSDDSTEFIKCNSGYGAEAFVLHPDNPDIIFVSFDGEIYKSEDGGDTYFASSSGYSGMRAADFMFDNQNENNIFIGSVDRGVVKTVDSDKGEEYPVVDYSASEDNTDFRYKGYKTVLAVARDPKNEKRIIVAVGSGDEYVLKQSFDGGNTYFSIGGTAGVRTELIEFNFSNPNTIYAGNIISYDNGETWNKSDVRVYAVSPFDGCTVYGIKNSCAARSFDEGRTWEIYSSSIFGTTQMIADKFEDGVVYCTRYPSSIAKVYSNGVYEIISAETRNFENASEIYIWAFDQNPRNPEHLICGGVDNSLMRKSGGIYESFDGGENWRQVKGLPATRDVWKIEFHPSLPKVYLATSAGTYVYEYEKYAEESIAATERKLTVTSLSQDRKNCSVTYSMKLWNTEEKVSQAAVYIVSYDKNSGALLNVDISKFTINAYDNVAVNRTFETKNGSYLKIFVWNDGELTPLNTNYGWEAVKYE